MTRKLGWKITILIVTFMVFLIATLAILLHNDLSKLKPKSTTAALSISKTTSLHTKHNTKAKLVWHKITVQRGDALATIFNRLNIKQSDLLMVAQHHKKITMLHPGETIYLQADAQHHLQGLKYRLNSVKTLRLTRQGNQFVSEINKKSEMATLLFKTVTIDHSLVSAANHAGLAPKIVGQLETIFGGSINFARDIHAGDRFSILYREYFINGKKTRDGNIMAAEFTNRGKTYKALRYTYPIDHCGYYTPNGHSIEARFLRAPLHYKYISSYFSYHRMDPIAHRVQPHLGIDFAARKGTPIQSIGDGRIVFIGKDDGYGNTIRIRYDRHYEGLYAHMNHFAKNMRLHKYVHKGQVIGYVGETGWATGPHLHFGFFINGVAKNWLAMKLPTAVSIPRSDMKGFAATSKRLLAKLQLYQDTKFAANNTKALTKKSNY